MLHLIGEINIYGNRICFSETHFYLNGFVYKENWRMLMCACHGQFLKDNVPGVQLYTAQ